MNTKSGAPKQGDDTGYCAFVVGQHVVYVIDDIPSEYALALWDKRGLERPVKNKVYTVREVFLGTNGRPSLLLREIANPKAPMRDGRLREPGFEAARFRPLKKLKVEDFLSAPVDRERVSA